MLRAQQRQLRELIERRQTADVTTVRLADKKRLKTAIDTNTPIPRDLRQDVELREKLDLEDDRTLAATTEVLADDEFRTAGTYEPRVMITTSQKATAPTIRFTKELSLMIPNAQRINRGQMSEAELIETCRAENVTDLIEISGSDGEGRPKLLKICHLPFGPTLFATLSNILMRSDLETKPEKMKQEIPHLIFHNFDGRLGGRVQSCLKYIFPKCSKEDSKRIVSFINLGSDKIHVRNLTVENTTTLRKFHQQDPALNNMTTDQKNSLLEKIQLQEQGPRFTIEPFKILRGTPDQTHAETEWQKSFYIRKIGKAIGR